MRKTIIYVFLFVALGLAGCSLKSNSDGEKDLFENSITVNKDGSFVEVVTDFFDEDYYSIDGLKAMINEEISMKNISLENALIRDEDKAVSVTLKYKDLKAYNDFENSDLFYGSLTEAFFEGRLKNISVYSVKDKTKVDLDSEFIQKNGELNIIITKDNMPLYTFGEVLLLDGDSSLVSKNKVEFLNDNQKHIIIFK